MLEVFHESADVFLLKDVEKLAARKGVVLQVHGVLHGVRLHGWVSMGGLAGGMAAGGRADCMRLHYVALHCAACMAQV